MIVAIHQPHYLPWLGYMDKLDQAEAFVVLDTVQFVRREHQNRNRIREANGWMWLTVPVKSEHKAPLLDVIIDKMTTMIFIVRYVPAVRSSSRSLVHGDSRR